MADSEPHRWYPGYTVAFVCALAHIMSAPGQTLLISLLNLPLRNAFGITPLTLNTTYTVATIAASLPLPWIGRTVDRFGPRRMMPVIAWAFGAACVFMAVIPHPAWLIVGFFMLRLGGQGSLVLVSQHALAMWFHRRLGMLTGGLTVAVFVAWSFLPTVTQALIDHWGWRLTWAILGVTVATSVSIAAAIGLRNRPEDLGWVIDGSPPSDPGSPEAALTLAQARTTGAYWRLAAANILPGMIATALLFDLQPMLQSKGVPASVATTVVGAWSLTMALLALPVGRWIDRVRPSKILPLGCLALAMGCAGFALTRSSVHAAMAMVACACGQSTVSATISATTARYFGRRHHGAIRSALSRVAIVATGMGPLSLGVSHRLTGDYDLALWTIAGVCVPIAFVTSRLRAPAQIASSDARSDRASESS